MERQKCKKAGSNRNKSHAKMYLATGRRETNKIRKIIRHFKKTVSKHRRRGTNIDEQAKEWIENNVIGGKRKVNEILMG